MTGAKNVMPLYCLQGTCNIVDFYHLLSWIVSFPGWKVPAYSDILVPNQLSILDNTCCSPWIFLIIKKKRDTKSKREREKERSDKHSQSHMGLGMCFSLTMRTANCTATISSSKLHYMPQYWCACLSDIPCTIWKHSCKCFLWHRNSLKHNF